MKNGVIISQRPVNQIDSIIFYRPTLIVNYYTDPRDNHVYSYINVNGVNWMGENLAYLPSVTPPSANSQTNPCYYVNGYYGTNVSDAMATSNYNTYGALYNWPAALQACPPNWHLPSEAEWTALATFLGGFTVAGGALKESGYSHWNSPNTGATDQVGFTGYPGGYRDLNSTFCATGNYGYWWSSQPYNTVTSKGANLFHNEITLGYGHHYNDYGFSVRCIQN